MTRLERLKAIHADSCGDEGCRGCLPCYVRTGDTICDRSCEHATEDDYSEREHELADEDEAREAQFDDERDEAYERAAARARMTDFEDTGGKDWT